MPVFAADGKREAGWIRETCRCSVHYLGDQSKRLESSRTKLLYQQDVHEAFQIPFVCDGQHSSEPREIHVTRPHVVVTRQDQGPHLLQNPVGMLSGDANDRVLSGPGMSVYQVQDGSRMS